MSKIPERIFVFRPPNGVDFDTEPCHVSVNEHSEDGWYEYHLAPKWVSVKDGLPEEEGEYFILMPTADNKKPLYRVGWWHKKHEIWEHPMLAYGFYVTHWMPVPAPPESPDE